MKQNYIHVCGFSPLYRGLTVLLLTVFFSFSYAKPVSGQVTAVFTSSQDYLMTGNGQFYTIFILEANKENFGLFTSRALQMPETLTFESRKVKKNQYRCSIRYKHPTDAYYVKKTLLNLGIEQLRINNKIYSLPDYDPANK